MLHWNAIGWGGVSLSTGARRLGAAGTGGVDGGVDVPVSVANLVTKPSIPPLKTMSKAPAVVGKSIEKVWPTTKTLLPLESIARSSPPSDCAPPDRSSR